MTWSILAFIRGPTWCNKVYIYMYIYLHYTNTITRFKPGLYKTKISLGDWLMGGGWGGGWHNNLISKLLDCQFGEKRYEIRKKCQPLFDYDFEKKKKEKRIWGKSNYHPHAIQTNKQMPQTKRVRSPKRQGRPLQEFQFCGGNEK